MPRIDADRNLLFGINALQNDFITREALIAGMAAWALEKHRPLGDILVEMNALEPGDRALLDQLIDRLVVRHGGDPLASLTALSAHSGLVEELRRSVVDRDPDPLDSLATVVEISAYYDPYATQSNSSTAASSPRSAPPSSRFRKVREHAAGNLGVVYVAHDGELNREVALKEIKEQNAYHPYSQAKFLLEAEVTGGLEHPGIVPVYGLGHHDDGRPYYAMRFIRGKSLLDAIKRFHADDSLKSDPGARLLALQQLLRRFTDVCNAIAYAHSRGVLHRDLKPDNVMVGKYGETLVVDWGLAKALGTTGESSGSLPGHDDPLPEGSLQPPSADALDATRAGTLVGTPAYMSPEQAAGRLDLLGPPSDIYGLGATLYHLIVGKPPISATTLDDLFAKIQVGDFPHPRTLVPWLDPALEAIGLKAMALKPEDRYATPRTLAEDLDRWIAGEPVTAYPEPFRRRAGRWTKKHRTGLATAASAATVAALLLGSVAWFRTVERQRVDASALASLEASGRQENESQPGDPTRWTKAANEAQRAVDQLAAGGSPALLRMAKARLEALQGERDMVAALEEARLRETNVKDGGFDHQAKVKAYLKAFHDYGIDIATLSDEAVAGRVRSSKIANDLIAALDDWSRSPTIEIPRERLVEIARAADTDPVLVAIREAVKQADTAALRRFCESEEDRRKLGPRLRYVFQSLHGLDPAGSFPLLEAIVRERPSDFWLNHELGRAYWDAKPPRFADAVRYLSVAVALRPDSPGVHVNLGIVLKHLGKADLAVAEYRDAIRLKPDYTAAHYNLGNALKDQGQFDLAIAEFRDMVSLKPKDAEAHCYLGYALAGQGKVDEAIAEFRDAIRLKPDEAMAHYSLGIALTKQGKADLAVAAYREAIRLQPEYAEAHTNLGNALRGQGKRDEAIAEFRDAIRFKPDLVEAHYSLGRALSVEGKTDLAIAEYRDAIRLKPDYAQAHTNLGVILAAQGKIDEAVAEYRDAIRIKPDLFEAHADLADALASQGKLDEAVAENREAIRLKPDLGAAHFNLGTVLQAQGQLDLAIAEFREVIRLDPNDAGAHYLLGNTLNNLGKTDLAIAEFRDTIRLQPNHAEAHCNLGSLLRDQGQFREALEQLEQGHALGMRRPDWSYASAAWVRDARRLVELEAKLPAILKGEARPEDAAERLTLADICSKTGRPEAAARFADEAFAETPALADDLAKGSRYNAACSASLAGSGQGKDNPRPDEAARAKLREKALGWLRADLAAWGKVLDGGNEPARKQFVVKTLVHWKEDTDLAGIRDEAALAKCLEDEREGFRSLWAEVDKLLAKARAGAP